MSGLVLDCLQVIAGFLSVICRAAKVRLLLLLLLMPLLLATMAEYAVISAIGHHMQVVHTFLMFNIFVHALLAVGCLAARDHDLCRFLNAALARFR